MYPTFLDDRTKDKTNLICETFTFFHIWLVKSVKSTNFELFFFQPTYLSRRKVQQSRKDRNIYRHQCICLHFGMGVCKPLEKRIQWKHLCWKVAKQPWQWWYTLHIAWSLWPTDQLKSRSEGMILQGMKEALWTTFSQQKQLTWNFIWEVFSNMSNL